MIFLKKLLILLLILSAVILTAMIWDYQTNNRSVSAELHTVCRTDYQEEMSFTAPIFQYGNLYLMSGAARQIDNIYAGATATVTCKGNTYPGYLWRLKPTFDNISYATVSVTGVKTLPKENATAVIKGSIRRNLIFVPKECLVTDEMGQDAVFVAQDGYAMLRKVELGTLSKEGELQIVNGLFAGEKLVISPKNIRTGDRVLAP